MRFLCSLSPIMLAVRFSVSLPCGRALAADGARVVQYAQTDIIPIHAKLRFSTLIVLPATEEILDFTTGDKDFWIINGAHNLCYVHPAQAVFAAISTSSPPVATSTRSC